MLSQPPLWLILIAFICMLGPLVFIHEFGHYYVARLLKIPAEAFSIGFGREVVGWTDRQGTRWKVGWLPLGGYVRFVGDMTPASNPAEETAIPPEMRDRAFSLRPVWQRFLVVAAGPMANFLAAIVIFAAFFALVGAPMSNVVGKIMPGTAAEQAGFAVGDKIVAVDGMRTSTFADLLATIAVRPGERVAIRIERDGVERSAQVTLGRGEFTDSSGQTFERGMLGIEPSLQATERVSPLAAIPLAVTFTWRMIRATYDGLLQMIRGNVSPKQLGGPIKIAQIAGEGASAGLLPFVQLVAFFSINLGFINLLPVPMLDGGHLAMYTVEAVRRRPLSARSMEWAFRGGLALILALVVFTTVNDLGSVGLWDRLHSLIG